MLDVGLRGRGEQATMGRHQMHDPVAIQFVQPKVVRRIVTFSSSGPVDFPDAGHSKIAV
jgi:hypothetical protein